MLRVIHVYLHSAVVVVSGRIRKDPRHDVLELPALQPTVDEYAVGVADDDDLVAVGVQGDEERLDSRDSGYVDDGVLDLPGIDGILVQEFQDPAHVRDPAAGLIQMLHVLGYPLVRQQLSRHHVGVAIAYGVIEIECR